MKKIFFCSLFVITANISVSAQALGVKWLEVFKNDSQSVYLDTANIKHAGNQITIVNMSVLKTQQMIPSIDKEVKSIKSQVLFNIATRKYTTLGTLYYDNKLRIVEESSLSGVSVGSETFATPIDSNLVLKILYTKSIELLSIDTTEYENQTNSNNRFLSLIDSTNNTVQGLPVENNKTVDKNKPIDQKNFKSNTEVTKPLSSSAGKSTTSSSNYVLSNERNVKSTIFTDGNKYCFQVSSWKNKSKAEREMTRLQNEGHSSFLVETYLPNKGGTWYRVRIGYFSSLEETENYLERMK